MGDGVMETINGYLPIARCVKCAHYVYPDDNMNMTTCNYIDPVGDNVRDYSHKICPTHRMIPIRVTTEYRCQDCDSIIIKSDP
jgi:hypothetical protein